jgi:small ligand-binding sensory domain FIST
MQNRASSHLYAGPFEEAKVIEHARAALEKVGGRVTCGIVFASADYGPHMADFLELVQLHAHAPVLVGCSGIGLIGTDEEQEKGSGFTLLLLYLPETSVRAVPLPVVREENEISPERMRELAGPGAESCSAWIVLANPLTLAVEPWLDAWNSAFPGVPALGGLASGGLREDSMFVFHERELVEGGIALGFAGGVKVRTIVSQGCRPVGEPFTITGAEGHLVTTLSRKPAFEVLDATFGSLPPKDRAVAKDRNLFVGLAMSEYLEEFKTGDFLVRNLIGGDPQSGVLAVGTTPRVGQTLQFQLRDRGSADAELRQMLEQVKADGLNPFATLLFCCNGRGRHLFGVPNHDAGMVSELLGPLPSAGFFCNGEIGPVGGRNYVHGYTASMALFCSVS